MTLFLGRCWFDDDCVPERGDLTFTMRSPVDLSISLRERMLGGRVEKGVLWLAVVCMDPKWPRQCTGHATDNTSFEAPAGPSLWGRKRARHAAHTSLERSVDAVRKRTLSHGSKKSQTPSQKGYHVCAQSHRRSLLTSYQRSDDGARQWSRLFPDAQQPWGPLRWKLQLCAGVFSGFKRVLINWASEANIIWRNPMSSSQWFLSSLARRLHLYECIRRRLRVRGSWWMSTANFGGWSGLGADKVEEQFQVHPSQVTCASLHRARSRFGFQAVACLERELRGLPGGVAATSESLEMEIDGVRCCCYPSGSFLIPSDNLALVLMLCKGRSTFLNHCFPSWVESLRLTSGQELCHILQYMCPQRAFNQMQRPLIYLSRVMQQLSHRKNPRLLTSMIAREILEIWYRSSSSSVCRVHSLTYRTHIFLLHSLSAHIRTSSCVSHTRMIEVHEKKMIVVWVSFLFISSSPFSCLSRLCCSCTDTSRTVSTTTSLTPTSTWSCRTFPS